MLRVSSEIHNERHDQKSHNCNDFDTGKQKLGLSIYCDGEDVKTDDKNDDQRDPGGDVNIFCSVPILNNNRSGRDFGT